LGFGIWFLVFSFVFGFRFKFQISNFKFEISELGFRISASPLGVRKSCAFPAGF